MFYYAQIWKYRFLILPAVGQLISVLNWSCSKYCKIIAKGVSWKQQEMMLDHSLISCPVHSKNMFSTFWNHIYSCYSILKYVSTLIYRRSFLQTERRFASTRTDDNSLSRYTDSNIGTWWWVYGAGLWWNMVRS